MDVSTNLMMLIVQQCLYNIKSSLCTLWSYYNIICQLHLNKAREKNHSKQLARTYMLGPVLGTSAHWVPHSDFKGQVLPLSPCHPGTHGALALSHCHSAKWQVGNLNWAFWAQNLCCVSLHHQVMPGYHTGLLIRQLHKVSVPTNPSHPFLATRVMFLKHNSCFSPSWTLSVVSGWCCREPNF